jgi:hypothetical protein
MSRTALSLTTRLGTSLVSGLLALPHIADALEKLTPLAQAVLGPLQGTTERLGRLVDRLPDRRRRSQALPG